MGTSFFLFGTYNLYCIRLYMYTSMYIFVSTLALRKWKLLTIDLKIIKELMVSRTYPQNTGQTRIT